MKIAFFEVEDNQLEKVKKLCSEKLSNHEIKISQDKLTMNNIENYKDFDMIAVFIYSKIDKDILKKLPKLKMIATCSTGFDHIDIAECAKRDIAVANVPLYGENTVAEHTFALILSISRNIHKTYMRTSNGQYSRDGLRGFDLKGKTIGVVGTGNIGLHVIRMARGFGMNVIAFDVKKNNFMTEILGFKYVEFDELLANSDIITLHAPLNKYTEHMINTTNIKKVKRGAILINTARGGLVDSEAILIGLDEKILSGAGLDVIEGEEFIQEDTCVLGSGANFEKFKKIVEENNLLLREEVVFTPHNAFNSNEALFRIFDTTTSNLKSFIDGKSENIVKLN
jgi:D-lactate dehydrogenase